jgi:hypothetical protein
MSTTAADFNTPVFEPSGSATRRRPGPSLWARFTRAMQVNGEARARRMIAAHFAFRSDAELLDYGLSQADIKRLRG